MAAKSAREALEAHLEDDTETELDAEEGETEEETPDDAAPAPETEEASEPEEKEETVEPEPSEPDTESDASTSAPEPAPFYTAPPSSLNASEREAWQNWPREAQNFALRREREYQQGLQQAFTRAAQAERKNQEIDSVINEHMQRMQLRGESPKAVLHRMFAWDQFLAENPAQAIPQLLQAHGIGAQELQQFYQNPQSFQHESAAMREIQALREEHEREKKEIQQQQMQVFTQQMQSAREAFRAQVDRAGYLQDPSALQIWAHDVQNLVQLNNMPIDKAFHAAYERLIWGNPEYRAAHEKQKQQEAQKQRIQEEKRAAKKAQRAASSIQGAPDGTPQADKPKDARSLLELRLGA